MCCRASAAAWRSTTTRSSTHCRGCAAREPRGGRNMAERVFDRMKHYRKAATRHDRLDETFLANLQLILIAIYLKKHSQKPN
ncbi:hypothetical protein DVB78_09080 [Bifidobacterium longum subsp. longum]|nr:hypothetical protein DVB78_09080 [Bifidobacterium longum subsp. longum]RGX21187.1 hypothetical protein DWV28_09910 [Bifidobacterium longum]